MRASRFSFRTQWCRTTLLAASPLLHPSGRRMTEERKEKALLAEVNNGRLAMIAIAGMTVQELVTDKQLF